MDILYRKGKVEDCLKIAEGIDRASGGIVEFLFHGLLKDSTAAETMADFLQGRYRLWETYENAIVAECQGDKYCWYCLFLSYKVSWNYGRGKKLFSQRKIRFFS